MLLYKFVCQSHHDFIWKFTKSQTQSCESDIKNLNYSVLFIRNLDTDQLTLNCTASKLTLSVE